MQNVKSSEVWTVETAVFASASFFALKKDELFHPYKYK